MRSRKSSSVTIRVASSHLSIDGGRAAELLSSKALRFKDVGFNDSGILQAKTKTFAEYFSGRSTAGLWPAIQAAAIKLGITCTVASARVPNLGKRGLLSHTDPALIDFVEMHERGLIYHSTRVNVARCVAEVMRTFASATIAIVSPSRQKAEEFRRRLGAYGCKLSEIFLSNAEEPIPRVAVGSVSDFADERLQFAQRDLVIFPDAMSSLHEPSLDMFPNLDNRFRLFGLLDNERTLSYSEESYLRGTFGFEDLKIPCHGSIEWPTRTFFANPRFPAPHLQSCNRASSKDLFWRYRERNKRIASIARQFGSLICEQPDAFLPNSRLVVLVDSIEHLLQIGQFLRGWPLVTNADVNHEGFSNDDKTLIHSSDLPENIDHIVATVDGLNQMAACAGDMIVIWAGGGRHGPQILAHHRLHRGSILDKRIRHTFVLDFDLGSKPPYGVLARYRRRSYLDQGHIPVGKTEIEVRATRFLRGGRLS